VSARERKVVTVLFADLVGFTSRAEQLDPEDVEAILQPYHERLRYELERWGGTVEKFIGDAVVAFFGAPVAGEDDPERAVRAGLAIRDWIAEEGKLQVRIAVNSGEALVRLGARPESGEGMASGDVVNTAARLQSAAPTNGILVGETTYRATVDTIDYREHGPVEAKGKEEPVPVWEVVQARARFGVDLTLEARTPLVGRERELELLVGTLERARRQRSPELVTLVGVPGIGKSRLVGELFRSIERGGVLTYWRQGRSLPYGEGVSFWALAEMVKAQTGILETDGDDEVERKLRRTVEQLVEEDREWVLSHLRPLVGVGEAPGAQEEAFTAWRRFFEALAQQRPLVVVFEDVQWADDGLLDFIEHLADWVTDAPILIVCTARRELLERRPAWGGGKVNAAMLALAPLTDAETGELLAALSERPLLEAETQRTLLEQAGGNPLYAEQFVRMLEERGSAEELPESVQGIIAARLDALPPAEKALLQDAAVVGKVFWLGALAATEQQLHALQQKEFVQRARRSSVEGETEFAFKHLLVRDVAYGQIPRADRADKHLRVAAWIESLGRPEDHAEMVAHHYVRALELARAARHDVADIPNRTRDALRAAGDRAAALSALPQAERYYSDALVLTTADDPARPQLLFRLGTVRYHSRREGEDELNEAVAALDRETAAEAELLLASIEWHRAHGDGMTEHLERARALVQDESPSPAQVSVLVETSRYAMLADRNEEAVAVGTEALRLAEQLGMEEHISSALINVGSARSLTGEDRGFDELEQGIALASRLSLVAEQIRGSNNLAASYYTKAEVERAIELWEETHRLAERFGHFGMARFMEGGPRAYVPYLRGDWDLALERADVFIADVESGSPHYQASASYLTRALIRLGRGEVAAATADAAVAVEQARKTGDPQRLQPALARAARVFLGAGGETRAADVLAEALDRIAELPRLGLVAVEIHNLAWAGLRLGRAPDVAAIVEREPFQSRWIEAARHVLAEDFSGAAGVLGSIGASADEAFYRLQSGKEEDVRAAIIFYRGVGATRYMHEAEGLLAATA
jgi:class 3 adenylate cyclase/DNA-binding NarL/FixJ family response regulator